MHACMGGLAGKLRPCSALAAGPATCAGVPSAAAASHHVGLTALLSGTCAGGPSTAGQFARVGGCGHARAAPAPASRCG